MNVVMTFFFLIFIFILCVWVLCLFCSAHRSQKSAYDPLELELHTAISWEWNLDPLGGRGRRTRSWMSSSLCSWMHGCLSHSSAAVIKHHDQGDLWEKSLFASCSGGRCGSRSRTLSYQSKPEVWWGFKLSKTGSREVFPQARPSLPTTSQTNWVLVFKCLSLWRTLLTQVITMGVHSHANASINYICWLLLCELDTNYRHIRGAGIFLCIIFLALQEFASNS